METRKIPNLGCNSGLYPLPFLCAPKLKYPKEVADIRDIRDIETNKRYQELGNDYYFVPLGNETYESWETECLKFIKTIGKK